MAKQPKATTTNAAQAVPTYAVSAASIAKFSSAVAPTLQFTTKAHGLGQAWRTPKHTAPNTRAAVVTTLATLGSGFTAAQAVAAIAAAKLPLGSGTPNSYVKAFIANGYLQAAK